MKKALQRNKCPLCGSDLIKKRVFGRVTMRVCQRAMHGTGCTFRVRGHIKHQITTDKYTKPKPW